MTPSCNGVIRFERPERCSVHLTHVLPARLIFVNPANFVQFIIIHLILVHKLILKHHFQFNNMTTIFSVIHFKLYATLSVLTLNDFECILHLPY